MSERIPVDRQGYLDMLYLDVSGYPSWLGIADGVALSPLSDADVRYLEELDDVRMDANSLLARALAGWKTEIDFRIFDAENDEQVVQRLTMLIAEANEKYEQMAREDKPPFDRMFYMLKMRVKEMEAWRKKVTGRLYHKTHPDAMNVTQDAIERARQYPLEKLVERNRENKIICPFHADGRPSMFVKNGFGYCFSCGEWCDSIKWLMHVNKFTFMQAVERLQ